MNPLGNRGNEPTEGRRPSSGDGAGHAKGASRQSEDWLRSVVEHASDVLAVVEDDGTIRHVSPAVERVLGY